MPSVVRLTTSLKQYRPTLFDDCMKRRNKRKMLKRIRLKNFQMHQKTEIEIKDRILTIVGPSDVGKSSIIRALGFALLNQTDESHIRKGKKQAEVTAFFGKDEITRVKGKNKNIYTMNGEEYKAFGKKVPSPIQQVVNVNETAFQKQFDPPFWVGLSPGQLSKELNKIVDLSVIDESLRKVNQLIRENNTEYKMERQHLKEIKQELDDLSWFPAFSRDYKNLKKRGKRLSRICEINVAVRTMLEKAITYQNSIDRRSEAILAADKLRLAHKRAKEARQHKKQLRSLVIKTAKITRIVSSEKINTEGLESLKQQQEKLFQRKSVVQVLIDRMNAEMKGLSGTIKEIDRLHEIQKSSKKRCPVCGKPKKETK